MNSSCKRRASHRTPGGYRPIRQCRAASGLLFLVVVCALGTLPAAAQAVALEGAANPDLPPISDWVTWRFTWDNDVVFDSDNQFSNGISLQWHGAPNRRWEDVGGTPAFGKGVAKWFLPTKRNDLYFREGWAIGQSLQTPDDTEREDLIVDDVPYAAALMAQNAWIAFDDRRLYGFGWLFGIGGPAAMGEEVQKAFHNLIGSTEPKGWDNQLENEPLLNVYFVHQRKLARGRHGDIAAGVQAQAGNLQTAVDVMLVTRFGWHVPRGFGYTPDPIGSTLSYDAHLPPSEKTDWTFYGSLTARGVALGRVWFYDGNTFKDSHSIDHNTFVGSLIFGLHYQRLHWGVHLNVSVTTDLVDPQVAASEPNTNANFGTMMLEFRY
jgi:hypothetical protein